MAMRATLKAFTLFLALSMPAWAATVTRGPYLQLADATGITVVFETDVPSIGAVRFGFFPRLLGTVTELVPTTRHVLRISGLQPSTRYDYDVSVDGVVSVAGDAFRFRTYPQPGTSAPFRLFAWGDSGLGNKAQLALAERMAEETGEATLSLILGDIIYWNGEPELYDDRFFRPYAPLLRRSVVWPTIGNHDVGVDPSGRPYLDAFELPTNNPANSELYYSFDYGDVHFVCLDTHVSGHGAASAQLQWAAADLAASTAKWKIVFFHVPPYSGGTHADDALVRSGIVPLVEAAGVDVVFSGHSHVYERTYLLQNHAVVQADPSTYVKASADGGTLYVVSGSAGQSGAVSNPAHPLMAFQAGGVVGTSVMDVSSDALRGYFLDEQGAAVDLFRLTKGADMTAPRVLGARVESARTVDVSFDEPVLGGVMDGGVEALASWRRFLDFPPTAVTLRADQRTVRLVFDVLDPGDTELRLQSVTDLAGNTARDLAIPLRVDAIDRPVTQVRHLAPSSAPANDWQAPAFDDSTWLVGAQPLGLQVPPAATQLELDGGTTLYARAHFTTALPAAQYSEARLTIDYADGFIAFLNGVEIARQNLPVPTAFTTLASGTRRPGLTERRLLVVRPQSILRAGDNVLAVEVHGASAQTPSAFLHAGLELVRADPRNTGVPDAGTSDAGLSDAGVADAGIADAGVADAGAADAGAADAGAADAGAADAGSTDAGSTDAGLADAGVSDAGADDAGVEPPLRDDAGITDPGAVPPPRSGCGCASLEGAVFVGLLAWLRRRRR